MLPRRHRLQLRKERGFFQTARRQYSPNYSWVFKKTSPDLQVAIVVSKSVSLKATERNKIRRRIQEVIAQLLPEFCNTPLQLVILARKSAVQQTAKQTLQEIREMLQSVCQKV